MEGLPTPKNINQRKPMKNIIARMRENKEERERESTHKISGNKRKKRKEMAQRVKRLPF